jgi:hypothetical protein
MTEDRKIMVQPEPPVAAAPASGLRDSEAEPSAPVRTFDFRAGTNRWGYAMHAWTWKEAESRWNRKVTRELAKRATVMVHATPSPKPGDRLLMDGQSGKSWDLLIAEVAPCWNPRDMFTLTLEFDRPPLSVAPSLAAWRGSPSPTHPQAEQENGDDK